MLNISHKQLEVYKKSLLLVEEVYKFTALFPTEEKFGLSNQIRRSAVSICSNIGAERKRFYEISRSSLVELDTQFEISLLLKYVNPGNINKSEMYIDEIYRMLSKMIMTLSSGLNHCRLPTA